MKRSLIKIFSLLFLLTVVHITQTPAQAQANPCAGAPAPHLKTGIQVQITKPTSKDFPGAYLKAEPGRSGPVLRYLPVGTIVDVTDGPRCGSDKGYWWRVKLGDLAGWMAEVPVAGQGYGLEPPKAPPTATPLPSTVLRVLTCIQPVKPTATGTAPAAAAATEAAPAARLTRLVFATQEGYLQVSDNGGPSRTLVTFEPPPLALDLSPDGSAVLVVNYNGLYWVSVASGETVLVADATTFNLPESSWLSRVTWLPSGKIAAVEITTIQTDGLISYMLWAVSLDGSQPPFEADTGAQPADSVRRSPTGRGVIMLSSNDIAPFPKSLDDQSPSLLEFVPKLVASDPSQFVIPAITWAKDGTGFYTYIPASENAGPSDTVGGHLWYVGLNGSQTDVAKIPKVKATDYVIPSGDGQAVLVGRGATWTIQDPKSGAIVRSLPAVQNLFTWTPDNKGVVFTTRAGEAKYLGIDGSTTSPYVPAAVTDLYEIRWLPDGTILYAVRGKDGKLSFSVKGSGEDAKFMGIIPTVIDFSASILSDKPGVAKAPEQCK